MAWRCGFMMFGRSLPHLCRGCLFSADRAQPFVQFALLAVQLFRHMHLDAQIQFAMAPAAEFRQALALEAQHRAGLGAGRDGHAGRAVQGGHLQRGAQHGLGQRDGLLAQQIGPGPLEARIAPRAHHDEQVPGDAARLGARHPLAGDAQRHALLDPLRDLHRQIFLMLHFAAAAACLAGVLDDAAAPMAGGAESDLLDQDMFLFLAAAAGDAPGALACLSGLDRATLGTGAATVGTGGRAVQADLLLAAARHPLQRDVYLDLDARAARRPRAAAVEEPLERAAAEVEVEPAEDVLEVDAAEQVLLAETFHAGEAACVVFGALLRVGQDGVGLGDLLEALLGSRFLVAVGVIFQGEVAEGVLDRLLVGVLGDAEHLVVVTLCRNDVPLPFTGHRVLPGAAATVTNGRDINPFFSSPRFFCRAAARTTPVSRSAWRAAPRPGD